MKAFIQILIYIFIHIRYKYIKYLHKFFYYYDNL